MPITLSALPYELIHEILLHLASPSPFIPSPSGPPYRNDFFDTASFSALARTCKQLNLIVTPHLYRQVILLSVKDECLRRLTESGRLSGYVYYLWFGELDWAPTECVAEAGTLLRMAMGRMVNLFEISWPNTVPVPQDLEIAVKETDGRCKLTRWSMGWGCGGPPVQVDLELLRQYEADCFTEEDLVLEDSDDVL